MITRRHLLALAVALPLTAAGAAPVRVRMVTDLGPIIIELYPDKAPITVANFLAYADRHLLDGGSFYRTVSPRNDNNPAVISVIQGGLNRDDSPLPAIAHETTTVTGILHTDGVISMARDQPGTAGSEFFICLGDNPALDFGGARNKDGQGFAAFGKVVEGMDVVRRIHDAPTVAKADDPYMKGQIIENPVRIQKLSRN
ncbi:peptidylprolyl isomerase [Caulobacter sp. UNC279MFTsu5.1]|uniref:peptidylprolyl isomerase n=1 Tax=Caulobacter sp. UNC279MFTsu5.1 TaxID=1502775 RepID=UPI0008E1C8C7|nr:peptidylprolyl isomerase [Caulobacter sp. UNC279MFTsu5.1]SFK32410.1 peptidyl-prolyl cis-trans isomerase A (cyclophilin A) [Caulobacter sp. UNC279MFTsu5.1]